MATPIPFSKAFAPGGYDSRPIQTLASAQINNPYMRKTSNKVQNNGLPEGVNKTTLGAYRMGDSETSSGAIYPNMIHAPLPPPERKYPSVSFSQVGNNVYQPSYDDKATLAIINRIGEAKFKAEENKPYSDFLAQRRFEREVKQVERTAGLEELTVAREILRNAVAERRKQNEDDYMRRLIDAGLSADDAQDEIENVRRAAALQEARKPEDRSYQSKLLLTRIANQRGILSKVNEPLTSAAIMNPQPNQQIASAMGKPEIGFGNAPLDVARKFLTPDYYKRILRRSNLTQESADRDAALNQLIVDGTEAETQQGTFYPEMVRGMEREAQIEAQRTAAAQRLETVRMVGRRIVAPLFSFVFAPEVLTALFNATKQKPGQPIRYKILDIQQASRNDLILAINRYILSDPANARKIRNALNEQVFRVGGTYIPVGQDIDNLDGKVRATLLELNGTTEIVIPMYSGNQRATAIQFQASLRRLVELPDDRLAEIARVARDEGAGLEEVDLGALLAVDAGGAPLALDPAARAALRRRGEQTRRNRGRGGGGGGGAAPAPAPEPEPEAPAAIARPTTKKGLKELSLDTLKALATQLGLDSSGAKGDLVDRIYSAPR